MREIKKLKWVGSSLEDLKEFPEDVTDAIGYALYQVQEGLKPRNAKPLSDIGSGVMEIVSDFDTNTYRSVYTVKLGDAIYVLHCFQKKSKHGISTPKKEIDLIKQRLREALQSVKRGGH
jgi:phage-related protein